MKVILKKAIWIWNFGIQRKKSRVAVRRFGGTPKGKYSNDRA